MTDYIRSPGRLVTAIIACLATLGGTASTANGQPRVPSKSPSVNLAQSILDPNEIEFNGALERVMSPYSYPARNRNDKLVKEILTSAKLPRWIDTLEAVRALANCVYDGGAGPEFMAILDSGDEKKLGTLYSIQSYLGLRIMVEARVLRTDNRHSRNAGGFTLANAAQLLSDLNKADRRADIQPPVSRIILKIQENSENSGAPFPGQKPKPNSASLLRLAIPGVTSTGQSLKDNSTALVRLAIMADLKRIFGAAFTMRRRGLPGVAGFEFE